MTISPARTELRLLGPALTDPVPRLSLAEVVDLAERSELTGRGGAGFPTARKIAAVAASGSRPVVVGNAMEGEPLSQKDAVLLRVAPGLVLDGLEVLATALGAKRAVLAVDHRIDDGPVRAAAVARPVEVLCLDGGFVAGQESALVNRIEGRPGVPSDRLKPVWRRGVLVANAETLARLALLARHGDAAMPGTRLVSVSGSTRDLVPAAGVHEVAEGTSLGEVLDLAGVPGTRVRAVLVGGYHGTWSTDPAQPLEAGIVHVLDRRSCPLHVGADVATYLARESAGQCGPCVNGLPRMADALERLASFDTATGLVEQVDRMRALVVGRGACAHPDGTARFVASTMQVFAGHVTEHLAGRCYTS